MPMEANPLANYLMRTTSQQSFEIFTSVSAKQARNGPKQEMACHSNQQPKSATQAALGTYISTL